ncbi:MAG: CHAT domain-containing protein [Caldilineaceae bacterium]
MFTFPFEKLERENYLLRLGPARRGRRRLETIELQLAKEFGGRVFEAVFGGEILSCWRSSLDLTARNQQRLRLKIRLSDAPDLVNLPWEYLYSQATNSFPALSVDTPIVRYLDLSGWTPPLLVHPPLKVLVMISNPIGIAALNTEGEWQRIQKAFSTLTGRGLVQVERVDPTLPALLRALDQDEYHIFHFVGHGAYDAGVEDGILVLEQENRSEQIVSGQRLGALLGDEDSIRLVVLNACDGGRSSDDDPFTGVAQSLLQQGIPAVVAMQFEISDEAALVFAEEFYTSLAAGHPVDIALARTRKSMYAIGDSAEWGTPVLYLRTKEGQLFDIDASDIPAVKPVTELVEDDVHNSPKMPPRSRNLLMVVGLLALLIVLYAVGRLFWPIDEGGTSPTLTLSAQVLGLASATPTSTPPPADEDSTENGGEVAGAGITGASAAQTAPPQPQPTATSTSTATPTSTETPTSTLTPSATPNIEATQESVRATVTAAANATSAAVARANSLAATATATHLSLSGPISMAGATTMEGLTNAVLASYRSVGFTGAIQANYVGTGSGFSDYFCNAIQLTDLALVTGADREVEYRAQCSTLGRDPIGFQVAWGKVDVDSANERYEPVYLFSSADVIAAKPQVAAFIRFYLTEVDGILPQFGDFYTSAGQSTLQRSLQTLAEIAP